MSSLLLYYGYCLIVYVVYILEDKISAYLISFESIQDDETIKSIK